MFISTICFLSCGLVHDICNLNVISVVLIQKKLDFRLWSNDVILSPVVTLTFAKLSSNSIRNDTQVLDGIHMLPNVSRLKIMPNSVLIV